MKGGGGRMMARAAWADVNAVEGHCPLDQSDPRLAEHTAGDELRQIKNYITGLKVQ